MTPRGKSLLALGGTFVLGVLVGALLVGALGRSRSARIASLGRPGGFIEIVVERVIRPRDAEQRAQVLPIIEAVAERNREVMDASREQLRNAMLQLQEQLAPLLDEEQAERLARFALRPPPPGPGGPPPRRGEGRGPRSPDGR